MNIKNYWFSVPVNKVRIAAMVVVFFILANILTVFAVKLYYRYHNERVRFGYRLPDKFVLIRKELPAVFHFIEKNKSRYDKNIILLGDSVSYGAGNKVLAGENVGKYLEDNLHRALPGQKVKVWNLAVPGSKPGDTFFIYKKATELDPDLIIINFNYPFYTPSNIKSPLAHMWMMPDFDPDGRYREQVGGFLYPDLEHRIKFFVYRYVPIYRYRDLINGLVFKEQPAKKFYLYVNAVTARAEKMFFQQKMFLHQSRVETNGTTAPPNTALKRNDLKKNEWYYQDWSEKLKSIAWMYNNKPIDPETNPAYLFTREIAMDIKNNNINALVFMAGQNHKLLKNLIDNDDYRGNNAILNRIFEEQKIRFINFDRKIEHGFFVDNVHLTAAGNKLLADGITVPVLKELEKAKARKQ